MVTVLEPPTVADVLVVGPESPTVVDVLVAEVPAWVVPELSGPNAPVFRAASAAAKPGSLWVSCLLRSR